MPKTTTITVRLDAELKQEVEDILQKSGLTPSQAVALFFKQISLVKGLPFEPASLPDEDIPSDETLSAIDDSIHRRIVKVFSSIDQAFKDLEK